MTRTRQTIRSSASAAQAKIPINEMTHVPVKSPKKKANTPFSFARERAKLCKKNNVFWRLPFRRLVNEITFDMFGKEEDLQYRWQSAAIDSIQERAEEYLLELFEDANYIANHSGRPTLLLKDFKLARFLYDKHYNREERPETIHEKEFKEHAQKLKLKKERVTNRVVLKKEEPIAEEKEVVIKTQSKQQQTPKKPRVNTKKSSAPALAPASVDKDSISDDIDPNNL